MKTLYVSICIALGLISCNYNVSEESRKSSTQDSSLRIETEFIQPKDSIPYVALAIQNGPLPIEKKATPKKEYKPSQIVLQQSSTQGFKVLQEKLLPQSEVYTLDPNSTQTIQTKNGSTIHIPAKAFVNADGKIISGAVQIEFQEFGNSADMLLSKLPMIYKKNGEDLRFTSSGMFSIRGRTNSEDVFIAEGKNLKLDYKLARQNDSLDFYRMKPDSSDWVLLEKIKPLRNEEISQLTADVGVAQNIKNTYGWKVTEDGKGGIAIIELTKRDSFIAINDIDDAKIRKRLKFLIGKRLNKKSTFELNEISAMRIKGNWVFRPTGNPGTLIGTIGDDLRAGAGHTYPKVIAGLNVSTFGVYNCDQIYRIPNLKSIQPKYTINGILIQDATILSAIDLDYNGAFSWDPRSVMLGETARNTLFLFTKSGRVFYLSEQEFKRQYQGKSKTEFKMEEVTDVIKSSDDVAKLIGLELASR